MCTCVHVSSSWLLVLLLSACSSWGRVRQSPPPPLLCPPTSTNNHTCNYIQDSSHIYRYVVDGTEIDVDASFFRLALQCHRTSAGAASDVLSSPALPQVYRLQSMELKHMTLNGCALPAARTLLATFNSLGVHFDLQQWSLSLEQLPSMVPLRAHHFEGLKQVNYLKISGIREARIAAEADDFHSLVNLTRLEVWDVALSGVAFRYPPPHLKNLQLSNVDVERVSEELLSSDELRYLFVESRRALNVSSVGRALYKLHLSSPATTLPLRDTRNLSDLSLDSWTEREPEALSYCEHLTTLKLTKPVAGRLPEGWLVNCASLEKLEVYHAHRLSSLPRGPFVNSSLLTHLAFSHGALESLPEWFLQCAPNLSSLELDDNRLHALPSFRFLPRKLKTVVLSSNDLESGEVYALQSQELLNSLRLDGNPRLGDLCNDTGYSPLYQSTNLKRLILNKTRVSRVCLDWRDNMTRLEMLDLSHSNVTALTYEDLVMTRIVNTAIVVKGTPITINISREQFLKLNVSARERGALVRVDAKVACDCHVYWPWRALQLKALSHVSALLCTDETLLAAKAPDHLLCDVLDECLIFDDLPTKCKYHWRPDDGRRLARLLCESAGLTQVPRPNSTHTASRSCRYRLLLANNSISDLHLDRRLDDIEILDVRNNNLTEIEEETAKVLERVSGSLWLTGNPLACDCRSALLFNSLHIRASVADLTDAKCQNGRMLKDISIIACAPPAPTSAPKPTATSSSWLVSALAGGFAALLALAFAAVVSLASRERRFFLRAVLHRWGCLWRAAEPPDDRDRPYDAFITFSFEDEAVAREVVKRLEPPYRVCVHYRDWIPGLLIAEQIVDSVARSRRTVALVSRHFLDSTWAKVEFREAHTAALRDSSHRLVVVLLEEPHRLRLGTTLHRYLQTNTYVRWGDPWFWDKLRVALPHPRPATTATALTPAAVLLSLDPLEGERPQSALAVSILKADNDSKL